MFVSALYTPTCVCTDIYLYAAIITYDLSYYITWLATVFGLFAGYLLVCYLLIWSTCANGMHWRFCNIQPITLFIIYWHLMLKLSGFRIWIYHWIYSYNLASLNVTLTGWCTYFFWSVTYPLLCVQVLGSCNEYTHNYLVYPCTAN